MTAYIEVVCRFIGWVGHDDGHRVYDLRTCFPGRGTFKVVCSSASTRALIRGGNRNRGRSIWETGEGDCEWECREDEEGQGGITKWNWVRGLSQALAPAGGWHLAVYLVQECIWRPRVAAPLSVAFRSSGPSRESAALTTSVYFVHKNHNYEGARSRCTSLCLQGGVELPMRLESGGADNFEMLQCTLYQLSLHARTSDEVHIQH